MYSMFRFSARIKFVFCLECYTYPGITLFHVRFYIGM